MKSRRNMSDLFRESEGRLDRNPSPQSWQRLEERLNQRRGRHRTHRLRPYLMAAALLFLLTFSFLMTLNVDKRPEAELSLAQAVPQSLEELASTSPTLNKPSTSSTREAIAYSNRLHDPSRHVSVKEGEVEKKLMVRNP